MGSRRGGVGQSEEGDRTHAARLRRVPPCGVASLSPRPQDPPRSRCEAGRRGAETMGRGAGGTAPLRGAGATSPRRPGRRALTLTKSSMRGSLSSSFSPFRGIDSAMASWAGLRGRRLRLWLRGCSGCGFLPLARWLAGSLAHWTVRASSCPWLRSSAPPHASRATLRGLRSLPLQTAGRSPVGVAWAEQWPRAIGSCGGNGPGPSRRAWPRGRTAGERSSLGRPTKGARPRRGVPSPAPSQAGGKGSRSPSLTRSPSTAQLLLVGAK